MTAFDTNVIIRVITRDDDEQFLRAERLMAAVPCVVTHTVILETACVPKSSFGASRMQIQKELRALFVMKNVHYTNAQQILNALDSIAAGLDVDDAFHRATAEEAERLVTFDQTFAKKAKGAPGIPVELL